MAIPAYWMLGTLFIYRHLSYFLGTVILISHNHVKDVIVNMFYSMFVYLFVIMFLGIIDCLNIYTLSISLVISVVFETLQRWYFCKKYGMMHQDLKVQKQGKKGAALMRYSDEVIEEVRARNDVVDVIGGYIHLQKKGSNYYGLCPFHNEKSPSFSVSPQKQMYNCFGCGKGGNVITFVMDYENESFQEAVASLAERAGIELPQEEESEESRRQADY